MSTPPRVNFHALHAATPGMPGEQRQVAFEGMPADAQADAWAQLRDELALERWQVREVVEPEEVAEPVLEVIPVRRQSGSRSARRRDVFDEIPPRDYWFALVGEAVPESGRVRCPAPGHEDVHPSAVVYREPGRGWWCPACGAGGTAIDLAAHLTGIEPRGAGYLKLRRWIAERLLVGAAA